MLAACAALTPENRAKCVPKHCEDNSTKTLQCCCLGSPCVGGAKTVLCVFGCSDPQGALASQDRDGGAGRNQAAFLYKKPPDIVMFWLYDDIINNKSGIERGPLELLASLEQKISIELSNNSDPCSNRELFDKTDTTHQRKVAFSQQKVNQALFAWYKACMYSKCMQHFFSKRPAPGESGGFSGYGT